MQDNSFETSFEKSANLGGGSAANANTWTSTMSGAGEGPSYFGERSAADTSEATDASGEAVDGYNKDISEGAAILNYGLNGAAAQLGVGVVVEGIKNFDVSSSENPVRDLLNSLGIDSKPEFKELRENQAAHKDNQNAFYDSDNGPVVLTRSNEGARKAIEDMQDLIRAVEKDDDDYADLREAAKVNNKNLFEQAITEYKVQDLASLFSALTEIKRQKKSEFEKQEEIKAIEKEENADTVLNEPEEDEDKYVITAFDELKKDGHKDTAFDQLSKDFEENNKIF